MSSTIYSKPMMADSHKTHGDEMAIVHWDIIVFVFGDE